MKRVTTIELSAVEKRALAQLEQAAREHKSARRARDDFIGVCLELGLPVRLIGEHAKLSGAQISRVGRVKR